MLLCSCSTSRKKKKREYHRVENGKAIKSEKGVSCFRENTASSRHPQQCFLFFRFFFSALYYLNMERLATTSSVFRLLTAVLSDCVSLCRTRAALRAIQEADCDKQLARVRNVPQCFFFFFFAHLGFRRQRKKKKRAYLAAPVFVLLCFVLFSSSCLCSPFRYALT